MITTDPSTSSRRAGARKPKRSLAPRANFVSRWLFPGALIGLAVATVMLGLNAKDLVLNSRDGNIAAALTDPAAPGFAAEVVPTPTLLVVQTTDKGEMVSAAILSLVSADGGGTMLFFPSDLLVKLPTGDSATLANKGLELIEAQWLFGLQPGQCTAVLHPQSIVHCLVEFVDGAMLAQLSPPSMTFPIQHALLHPERAPGVESALDFTRLVGLEFKPVDEVRFPMLRLARETMVAGGVAPAIYNAANELAVAAFLDGGIPFLAIPDVVEHSLASLKNFEPMDLPAVLGVDAEARRAAADRIRKLST